MSKSVAFLVFLACVVQACPFQHIKLSDMTVQQKAKCPHVLLDSEEGAKRRLGFAVNQRTKMGCKCTSTCGSTVTDKFNCPWCYTGAGCGKKGISGWYDYCVFPVDKSYESQTADTKMTLLWNNIDGDHTSSTYPFIGGIVTESVQTTFDNHADVMPEGRVKYIHSMGAVCKFSMTTVASSPFTGIFAPGETAHGLIRLGSALPVTKTTGVVPGVGVKFLRTGVEAANYVALNNLGPLPDNSYNFFQLPLTTHIPAPGALAQKILAKKFIQASQCITMVGLSDVCTYHTNGTKVDKVVFPYKLDMTSSYALPNVPTDQDGLQTLLSRIPANTKLYDITAYTSKGGLPMHIGAMVLNGTCVNSKFGDEHLFFRHQLIEEDWVVNPSYMPGQTEMQTLCGGGQSQTTPPQPQCSTN